MPNHLLNDPRNRTTIIMLGNCLKTNGEAENPQLTTGFTMSNLYYSPFSSQPDTTPLHGNGITMRRVGMGSYQ
jgi:hypothetical protein